MQKPSNATRLSPNINVTPLVDVVLVLLIVFMVITPALSEGVVVELPKVSNPDTKMRELNPVEITVFADGSALVDGARVTYAELQPAVSRLHQKDPGRSLILKSDESTQYGKVREAFQAIQNTGFRGVLLKVSERKNKS